MLPVTAPRNTYRLNAYRVLSKYKRGRGKLQTGAVARSGLDRWGGMMDLKQLCCCFLHLHALSMSGTELISGTEAAKPLVLIVDDETSITMTCSAILESHGYRTAIANDGKTALQKALEIRPDLVFSDVVMPGLNGVSLAIALTEALPETRILLFSGNTATADILAGARDQGYSFRILAKPVPIPEMLEAVRTTLHGAPPVRVSAAA